MKVQFSDITLEGNRYVVSDSNWVTKSELTVTEIPKVEIILVKIDDINASLEGSLNTAIMSDCCRCGCSLVFSVGASYNYVFRLGDDNSHHEKEFEFSDEDCQTVYLKEPEIDVEELLREQLILAVPEKLLCSEDCKGLCQNCGAMLNVEKCSCAVDDSNSPFAVLKKLKNKQS